ncbi:chymotrypsin inhibitor [Megalopta genalis]|uniref:chymotrypsin inhibitor n=1 Tax=Megalopta genalis TaxID=115081 RepID=UPI0014433E75|nr:chymotrypsin inhibitor-like [Megalopta genalis]
MSRTFLVLLFAAIAYIGVSEVAACGVNEEFKICKSLCEQKCGGPHVYCIQECRGSGCQCKVGFLRNDKGKCVSRDQC